MQHRLAGLVFILFAYSGYATAAPEASAQHPYRYYLTGSSADVQRPTRGLLVLQGGGDDVDHNYVRMGELGGGGDFVVLRASGDDDYNEYIYKLCHCDSVETLVVDTTGRLEIGTEARNRHGPHPRRRRSGLDQDTVVAVELFDPGTSPYVMRS